MDRPRLAVTSITIGSDAPNELAVFYADLLGWPITGSEPEWAQLAPPQGTVGPTLNFEFERHFSTPVWPAAAGQPVATQHLDIHVDDLDAAQAWAVARGARVAAVQPQADVRVMLDPSGHPFCLFI